MLGIIVVRFVDDSQLRWQPRYQGGQEELGEHSTLFEDLYCSPQRLYEYFSLISRKNMIVISK